MQVEAWLARAARTAPAAIAIETPAASMTYAQLWDAAARAAGELAERGARRGDAVAIALPAGVDFAIALHACLLLGAVAVPLDLRLTAAERARTRAGARVLVDASLVDAGAPRASAGVGADLALGESAGTGNTPPLERESDSAANEHTYTHDLDAVCAIIHTSGTTSEPRPIGLTYGNLLWSAIGSGVALGVDPQERWLCALPLAHVGALSILLRSAIYGTTAVIHERFETGAALAALLEQRITLVSLVATTLARLLDAGLREPPALRHALTGGGPVPAALVRRARAAGVPVTATYGLTEACSQVSTGGPPLFCSRVRIARAPPARSGDPAVGEILVAGPTVAPASLRPDGWLHTGDLGRLDAHGNLSVEGRAAETIVSGGENVSPSEVEAVLEEHPAVLEAAVVGREDTQWGEAVTAVVVLRGGPVDEASLRAHCAARLAPFKVPKRVTFRTAPLPRTRSGKLLRRELRRSHI
jgi:o-succinylbenzoate---CoA ligase